MLKPTRADRRDAERVFARAKKTGQIPTDMEIAELMMLKVIRDEITKGKMTTAALRTQFGGVNRESTIRKAARAMGYYIANIKIIEDENGNMSAVIPDGMPKTFAALKEIVDANR